MVKLNVNLKKAAILFCLGGSVSSSANVVMQSSIIHYTNPEITPKYVNIVSRIKSLRFHPSVEQRSWRSIRIRQNTYFSYDARGNLLAKIVDSNKMFYAYNAINQLIQIQEPGGEMISLANDYDALGNMKHDPAGNPYQYNLLGQLVQFQNLQTGIKADYQYYANGLRSKKVLSSNPVVDPIYYYYDNASNANIVNERQGALASSYLLPSGHMVRYVYDGESNVKKQITVHGAKDVTALVNDQGKIQKTYHYSPNGMIMPINPQGQTVQIIDLQPISSSITDNPFQYSGEYRDLESGLDYLRARYYDPRIQRFIQWDSYPLLNRYNYVDGNPIIGLDPSGHLLENLGWLKTIIESVLGNHEAAVQAGWVDNLEVLFDDGTSGKYTGQTELDFESKPVPHGFGTLKIHYPDGQKYEYKGEFNSGQRDGWAREKNKYPNGKAEIYVGEFQDDDRIKGKADYVTSQHRLVFSYNGEWSDNQMTGSGELVTYKVNGNIDKIYQGHFPLEDEDSYMNGYCILPRGKQSKVTKGQWLNDKPIGTHHTYGLANKAKMQVFDTEGYLLASKKVVNGNLASVQKRESRNMII